MGDETARKTVGLPMYDPPELHALRSTRGGAASPARCALEGVTHVPDRLDRDLSLDALWGAPDLLFDADLRLSAVRRVGQTACSTSRRRAIPRGRAAKGPVT